MIKLHSKLTSFVSLHHPDSLPTTPPPCPIIISFSLTLNLCGFASTNSCTRLQLYMPNLLYEHDMPTSLPLARCSSALRDCLQPCTNLAEACWTTFIWPHLAKVCCFKVQNCIEPHLMTQPNVSSSLVRLQPCNHVFLVAYASIGGYYSEWPWSIISPRTYFCACVSIFMV